jgi:hypothetical protein
MDCPKRESLPFLGGHGQKFAQKESRGSSCLQAKKGRDGKWLSRRYRNGLLLEERMLENLHEDAL